MAKKEFKIGEVFQCGLAKLKVQKAKEKGRKGCIGCVLNGSGHCHFAEDYFGGCTSEEREDKTDVIFVKVEE